MGPRGRRPPGPPRDQRRAGGGRRAGRPLLRGRPGPFGAAPDPRAQLIPGRAACPPSEGGRRGDDPGGGRLAEEADAAEAAWLLLERRIRSIPILKGRRVVGIVVRRDLLAVLAAATTTSPGTWRGCWPARCRGSSGSASTRSEAMVEIRCIGLVGPAMGYSRRQIEELRPLRPPTVGWSWPAPRSARPSGSTDRWSDRWGANGLPATGPAALGTSPLLGYGARATT